jgi:acetate kinase
MYAYRIRKYIGAYAAAMNGLDAVVFTAGVGENSEALRKAVCSELTFLGIELDEERNRAGRGQERRISTDSSKVEVLVIPTNEEWVIARDTYALVSGGEAPGAAVVPEKVPHRR